MNIADIVVSLNGRDAGKRFIVIETQGEYSMLADGKGRRLEKPKKKKDKHIRFEDKAGGIIAEKLAKGEKITNNELRRMLAEHASKKETSDKEGGAPICQKTT